MIAARPDDEIEELAAALSSRQGLSPEKAAHLATKILSADDDIWTAALAWARSGEMPPAPEVEGFNPAELSQSLTPSQVWTALMALRTSPEQARRALRYSPGDIPRAPGGQR